MTTLEIILAILAAFLGLALIQAKKRGGVWKEMHKDLMKQCTHCTKKNVVYIKTKEGVEEPTKAWLDHAYPLKQVLIVLQGTKHRSIEDISRYLKEVEQRLINGDLSGEEYYDDVGYRFQVNADSNGPTAFDEVASRK